MLNKIVSKSKKDHSQLVVHKAVNKSLASVLCPGFRLYGVCLSLLLMIEWLVNATWFCAKDTCLWFACSEACSDSFYRRPLDSRRSCSV